MGIYDRDWYKDKKAQDKLKESLYDPKQFRGTRGQRAYGHESSPGASGNTPNRPQSPTRRALIWLVVVAALALLFHYGPRLKRNDTQTAGLAPTQPLFTGYQACTPAALPANGAVQLADPSRMRRSDVLYSGLEIANRHRFHVVAYLTDPGTGKRMLGLSVLAGQTAQASVPVGHYGLFILAGSSWCNDQAGFQDGARVNIRGGVEVQAGGASVLSLTSSDAARPEGFRISVGRRQPQPHAASRPQPNVKGPGFVDLTQRPDGHYYAAGYVNGTATVFMVDTGATLTTLSPETAYKSGIASCASRTFNTANGPAQGCVAKVSTIQIGDFVLRDFDVAVMPNLPTDALLGMNVMRMLRLEQQNGVMRLSIR
ncbi:retropepsin-like aspartic protease family protein [Thiobacillus sedimenti]|uniref:Retropepsin-like aspartic protease n=1 Tax=Thiobacillus sedimenti TaxID=3110231 RepID=A0ABZ1CRF6_9PROT|nr:retropepsin-like aspartic protease [Thiobacillus sp. SCUT-2]WRS40503.1 retropepsin-like aspartic protease [Thiobacillus sp. SCUT-2]